MCLVRRSAQAKPLVTRLTGFDSRVLATIPWGDWSDWRHVSRSPGITKLWLSFCLLQDFVSCIENYRRKGQELYASVYKDYVQVRNYIFLPWSMLGVALKEGREKEERKSEGLGLTF